MGARRKKKSRRSRAGRMGQIRLKKKRVRLKSNGTRTCRLPYRPLPHLARQSAVLPIMKSHLCGSVVRGLLAITYLDLRRDPIIGSLLFMTKKSQTIRWQTREVPIRSLSRRLPRRCLYLKFLRDSVSGRRYVIRGERSQ